MIPPIRRNAFTLVELLVVTGLLASLLSVVIVAMRPTEDAQIRQVANALTSAIMQTQTKALSRTEGAAMLVEPSDLINPLLSATASRTDLLQSIARRQLANTPTYSTVVSFGDVQQPIIGPALLALPSISSTIATVTTGTLLNADNVNAGFQIRFTSGGPSSEWFAFRPTGTSSGEVTLQQSLGQFTLLPSGSVQTINTLWPSGTALTCEIARWPLPTQAALSFPKFAAVDLRFSSIGDDIDDVYDMGLSSELPTFKSSFLMGRTSMCFDRTGTLTSFIPPQENTKDPTSPVKPTAPIYLLVAAKSEIDNTSGNTPHYNALRSDKSIWVAISPATGRVTTGKNVPSAKPDLSDLASQGKEVAIPIARERLRAYFRSVRSNVLAAP